MPRVVSLVQNIFNKMPKNHINPEEAVVLGAAIQGGIFKYDMTNPPILESAPLSLGIETMVEL